MDNVLGEQDTLELDQEEVEQLGKVFEDSLMGFLGDGVVTTGTEGAGNTLLKDHMASNLDGGSHCSTLLADGSRLGSHHRSRDQLTSQRHVQELEGPAEKGQVAGGEEESDDAGVGHCGRAGLLPLYVCKRG